MKWLESGTRRDICTVLCAAGELRGPQLKTRLGEHYGDHLDPGLFYDRLEALVRSGHVDSRVEGLDDVYFLTDEGERALRDHHAWMSDCLAAAEE